MLDEIDEILIWTKVAYGMAYLKTVALVCSYKHKALNRLFRHEWCASFRQTGHLICQSTVNALLQMRCEKKKGRGNKKKNDLGVRPETKQSDFKDINLLSYYV